MHRVRQKRRCGLTENAGHEFDGHEIGRQNIYRLKIDYITFQRVKSQSKVSCIIAYAYV